MSEAYRTEGQVAYGMYLRTDHWQRKREERLVHDKHACVDCAQRHDLQVHHISYARLGEELLSDIVSLCCGCHERRHLLEKFAPTNWARAKYDLIEYKEGQHYNREELSILADKMLLEDDRIASDEPAILFAQHLRDRMGKEIYASQGVVDPEIVSGMYNRTHPQGRGWTYPEERVEQARGFYLGSAASMLARRAAAGTKWRRWPSEDPRSIATIDYYRDGRPQMWRLVREAIRYTASHEVAPEHAFIQRRIYCDDQPVDVEFDLRDLNTAIKRRSLRQREALYWHVIRDLSQISVAKIMAITTVSVGQYTQRACELIAKEVVSPEIIRTTRDRRQGNTGRNRRRNGADLTIVDGLATMTYDERCQRALELRNEGYTLGEISKALGWPSVSGSNYAIQRARDRG